MSATPDVQMSADEVANRKLIVGLGNPGRKYVSTRHNVGFEVLAKVAQVHGAGPVVSRFQGELIDLTLGSVRAMLLCPLTYMNRSGQSVRQAVDFYKLPAADVLVVCDDINLPLGRLRFRKKGSAGGQKGLADIIRQLGSDPLPRLRMGVGAPPPNWDVADYVLSRFTAVDRETMDEAVKRAAKGVEDWVTQGTDYCMNQYNQAAD